MGFTTNISASRKSTLKTNEILENIVREKERRRKRLSELPFEDKIRILVEIQKMAGGVTTPGKSTERIIWQI